MFCNKRYVFLVISYKSNDIEILGVFTTFYYAKCFYDHYYSDDRKLKIIKKILNPTQHGQI